MFGLYDIAAIYLTYQTTEAMADGKKYLLRFTDDKTFPKLVKEAKAQKGEWSVNTLINAIIEDYFIMKKTKKP